MEQNMNNVDMTGLSDAALAAIAGVTRLGEAERAAAVRMLGITRGARVWTPRRSGLPTLTGLVPARDREAIYSSATWAMDYRQVGVVIAYILQAQGLARLSADLGGQSVAKIGTSKPENIGRRRADLGSAEYGAWVRGSRRYERRAGFEKWLPPPRLQLAPQHPLSPVRLCSLGIEVGLPPGLSPNEFEAEINGRLLPLRFQTVADSDAGSDLCAEVGIDTTQLRRFYKAGRSYAAATELTFARPQADSGALARMCADIVIDSVLGLLTKRPAR